MKRAYCEAMTDAIMGQNKTMPNDEIYRDGGDRLKCITNFTIAAAGSKCKINTRSISLI